MINRHDERLRVAIIYVNYNTLEELSMSISTCSEEQDFYDISFVIVDNNSKKQEFEHLNDLTSYSIKIIQLNDNIGFAAANNKGIQFAKNNNYDYFLLLNCDTLLTHNLIRNLLITAEKNEDVGIVSSRILYDFDRKSICYDGGKINKYKGSADIYNYMSNCNDLDNKTLVCSFASGCCMLIPTKIDLTMSENYFLYYEDADFSLRILESGYYIYVNRDAVVYHTESVSTQKKSNLYTYYFVRNRFIFIKDNISGCKKIISYCYSFLWVIKKILNNIFNVKYSIIGFIDFLKGKSGKASINF